MPYIPTVCQQQARPAATAAAPQQQQPPQQVAVANQHHHHQPLVEDDKTLLAPHQNIMQNYQYDATTGQCEPLGNICVHFCMRLTN